MKKSVSILLLLLSTAAFSADVCLILTNNNGTQMACGSEQYKKITVEGKSVTAAKPLEDKLSEGYSIINVLSSSNFIQYTLRKN